MRAGPLTTFNGDGSSHTGFLAWAPRVSRDGARLALVGLLGLEALVARGDAAGGISRKQLRPAFSAGAAAQLTLSPVSFLELGGGARLWTRAGGLVPCATVGVGWRPVDSRIEALVLGYSPVFTGGAGIAHEVRLAVELGSVSRTASGPAKVPNEADGGPAATPADRPTSPPPASAQEESPP